LSKKHDGVSKAYTVPGIDGGEITFSETIGRDRIKITATRPNCVPTVLFITAEQFEAICGFDSAYDGLEVKPSAEPDAVLDRAPRDSGMSDPMEVPL